MGEQQEEPVWRQRERLAAESEASDNGLPASLHCSASGDRFHPVPAELLHVDAESGALRVDTLATYAHPLQGCAAGGGGHEHKRTMARNGRSMVVVYVPRAHMAWANKRVVPRRSGTPAPATPAATPVRRLQLRTPATVPSPTQSEADNKAPAGRHCGIVLHWALDMLVPLLNTLPSPAAQLQVMVELQKHGEQLAVKSAGALALAKVEPQSPPPVGTGSGTGRRATADCGIVRHWALDMLVPLMDTVGGGAALLEAMCTMHKRCEQLVRGAKTRSGKAGDSDDDDDGDR